MRTVPRLAGLLGLAALLIGASPAAAGWLCGTSLHVEGFRTDVWRRLGDDRRPDTTYFMQMEEPGSGNTRRIY